MKSKTNKTLDHVKKEEQKDKGVKFIDWDTLKRIAKGDRKVADILHDLDLLHHKYRGKQATYAAKSIRVKLRRKGIYISKLGHQGPLHD